ncbi:hypothetical protein ACQ33O_05850 [Ferruginibacter sp. SUN002]|uniref:hypothetical protein n=1 Tax=Ferruginibacter sp. SUN002 TaxID=2937789 RepID=UPI003D36CCED
MIKTIIKISSSFFLFTVVNVSAQNVGIGTSTPRFPLSFSTSLGQKIGLWDDLNANGYNYGIGIQSGLLQFHTDYSFSDVLIGYGKSSGFTENFRFKGNGNVGIGTSDPQFLLDVNGQIKLRNDGNLSIPQGILFNAGAFPFPVAMLGMRSDLTWGLMSGSGNWGLNYSYLYGGLGVNCEPTSPLMFPSVLGKKISLYPGATGDVGFGVSGNRLQIFSDNPNADIAIGKDVNGTFTENFTIKPNGALAVSGNTGTTGQYLMSNGPSAPPEWKTLTSNLPEKILNTQRVTVLSSNNFPEFIPGLTKQYNMPAAGKVMVSFEVEVETVVCSFCGISTYEIWIDDKSGSPKMIFKDYLENGSRKFTSGKILMDVPAGTNYCDLLIKRVSGPSIIVGAVDQVQRNNYMIFEIID